MLWRGGFMRRMGLWFWMRRWIVLVGLSWFLFGMVMIENLSNEFYEIAGQARNDG